MSAAIVFDGVWKKFRRGEHHDSLRDLLPSLAARILRRRQTGQAAEAGKAEFWAVRDVSFDVNPGEALGIIGPNGAGKSTILKLLTRILKPTRGHCQVRGRTGALIEVAAGFHPDLTGRENIFLQGAIVGMKRAEIARKFNQIVDFAGVGEFIDTPVKRFSSGMNARLGFAVAANIDPDVLIIDEVLSVGDAGFQARCSARMRELRDRGVPLVFVSHNLPAMAELCTRALFISRGSVAFAGRPAETIQAYQRTAAEGGEQATRTHDPSAEIWIRQVQLLDESRSPADLFQTGRKLTIRIAYDTQKPVANPVFALDIHRADGLYCCGLSTRNDGKELGVVSGKGHVDLEISTLQLLAGCYVISVGIHRPEGCGLHDLHLRAYPLTVTCDRADLGVIAIDHRWRHSAHSQPSIREVAVS